MLNSDWFTEQPLIHQAETDSTDQPWIEFELSLLNWKAWQLDGQVDGGEFGDELCGEL